MSDDYRLQLSGNQINNLFNALVGVGAFWLTADANFNPGLAFGGTWTLVGTKLDINGAVYGSGKNLAITDGSNVSALFQDASVILTNYNTGLGKDLGTTGGSSGSPTSGGKYHGLPTKTQLDAIAGSGPSWSGLEADSVTCYIWQRTA